MTDASPHKIKPLRFFARATTLKPLVGHTARRDIRLPTVALLHVLLAACGAHPSGDLDISADRTPGPASPRSEATSVMAPSHSAAPVGSTVSPTGGSIGVSTGIEETIIDLAPPPPPPPPPKPVLGKPHHIKPPPKTYELSGDVSVVKPLLHGGARIV